MMDTDICVEMLKVEFIVSVFYGSGVKKGYEKVGMSG